MFLRKTLLLSVLAILPSWSQDVPEPGTLRKLGYDIDLRSMSRLIADELRTNGTLVLDAPIPGTEQSVRPRSIFRGGNVQVNDPALDYIQIFGGFRPFVLTTQSETSIAVFGTNVVSTYNTSAGVHYIPNPNGPGLVADRLFLSGYSSSQDGGRTWTSGFMPPLPGSIFTLGDPSVAVDRRGNFYFANLGANAQGRSTIQVNKSADGGKTFSPAVLVQQDDGGDKEWLAVGPDPKVPNRDNLYVTWTSFQNSGAQLRLGRSTDGGATWTTSIVFAPLPDADHPRNPQNSLQFTNPVVDRSTGRLYIPFIHFSNADQDFLRVLVSDDAGATFNFLPFNIGGAPDPTLLPVTQAGHLAECGASTVVVGGTTFFIPNLRLTIHHGADVGGALTGLPRWINATRLVTQPAFAANNGSLYMAWSNSTSSAYGDPSSHSNILLIRSADGGQHWSGPVQVNANASNEVQHVLPALALDDDGRHLHVMFYTQHADESVGVDLANSDAFGGNFQTTHVSSSSFQLAPTNIPLPTASNPYATTNYDRVIAQCYSLGEYLSLGTQGGTVLALWGDSRNLIQQPVNPLDPISGQTHPQEDVFFQALK